MSPFREKKLRKLEEDHKTMFGIEEFDGSKVFGIGCAQGDRTAHTSAVGQLPCPCPPASPLDVPADF